MKTIWIAVGVLALTGCPSKDKEQPTPAETTIPVATATAISSATAASTSSATAPGSASVYSGEGTMAMATLTLPEVEKRPFVGKNSDPAGVGPVKLKLVAHPDGRVDGDASGSLGDMHVVGRVFDDVISANLVPVNATASAFSGTVYGARSGKTITGDIHAASADGTMLRTGKITLAAP